MSNLQNCGPLVSSQIQPLMFVSGLAENGCKAYSLTSEFICHALTSVPMGLADTILGLGDCVVKEPLEAAVRRSETPWTGHSPLGTLTIGVGHNPAVDVRVSTLPDNQIHLDPTGALFGQITPVPAEQSWVGTSPNGDLVINSIGVFGHSPEFFINISGVPGNALERSAGGGIYVPTPVVTIPTSCSLGDAVPPGPFVVEVVGKASGSNCLTSSGLIDSWGNQLTQQTEVQFPTLDGLVVVEPGSGIPHIAKIVHATECEEPNTYLGFDVSGILKDFKYSRFANQLYTTESADGPILNPNSSGTFSFNQVLNLSVTNTSNCRTLNYLALFLSGRTRFQCDRDGQEWRKWAYVSFPGAASLGGVVAAWTWRHNAMGNFSFPADLRPAFGSINPGQTAFFASYNELEVFQFTSGGSVYIADPGRSRIIVFTYYS